MNMGQPPPAERPVVGVATPLEPPPKMLPTPTGGLVIEELKALRRDLVHEIRQLGESRGEKPGMFEIWPNTLVTSQRIRGEKIVFTCIDAAGCSISLLVGESVLRRYRILDGTTEFDFPYLIQSGQAVRLVDQAGVAVPASDLLDAWIVGFSE